MCRNVSNSCLMMENKFFYNRTKKILNRSFVLCLAQKIAPKLFENGDEKCQQTSSEIIPSFQIVKLKVHRRFFWSKSKLFEISGAKSIDWCHLCWVLWFHLVRLTIIIFDPGETSISPIENLKLQHKIVGTNRELLIQGLFLCLSIIYFQKIQN